MREDLIERMAEVLPPKPLGKNPPAFMVTPVHAAEIHNRFARLTAALEAARAYAAVNPLGGPATQYEAMAARIRAGETVDSVLADYGLCRAGELEAAREDAWQPIETAPKDGTRVMLGNAGGTWIAYWRPVFQSGYRPKNPWASAMLNHDHIAPEHRYKRPTHWRNVPTIDQARGKGVGK